MASRCYCVFEAVNRRLRQAVVGVTEHCDVPALEQEHSRLPPDVMKRWSLRDVSYKIVSREHTIREAFGAAAAHAASPGLAKLSVHVIG